MLDDLRNSASNSFQEEESPAEQEIVPTRRREPFLGMSAGQRFVIVLMLFLMTIVLSAGCLILTGRVVLPFF